MLKFNRSLLFSSLALCSSAWACGPDFPMMLSSDRAQTFAELAEPVFLVEVQALASTVPDLSAVVAKADATLFADSYDYQNERWLSATEQAEQQLLSKEQALIVQQMRQSVTVQQALAVGETLPAELRFYTAAAVAFTQKEDQQAIELFRQVLALPLDQQQQRRSWALYSLSRVLLRQYDVDHRAEVATLYQQLQQEVAAGIADPLQLAVASLGEQAKLAKQQGDWTTAIALYAAQSRWSESGRASLLWLSKELAAMPDQELMPLVHIPAVAGLLSRYLMTQFSALSYMDPDQLQRLLVVLNQVPDIQLHNATQLAVAAYQQGQFALAEQLLPHLDQTALAFTLRAKMALKAGDTAKAAEFYAKASKSFAPELTQTKVVPVQQDYYSKVSIEDLQTLHYCRVQAEHGILELSRGDYLQAISLLTAAGMEYWQDTAYIAERVLTLEELINFVALHPVTAVPEKSEWHYFGDTPVEVLLHHLTARRLMRAGHYQQAQAYFVDAELKQLAKQYQSYAEAAQSSWTDNAKAEALFEQAKLTRVHGLELLGFELAPDYQVFYGQLEPYEDESRSQTLPVAELQRLGSSAPTYNSRFHYRHFAADLSAQSAELVPKNSQAFVATLCHSTKWLLIRQPELAQGYYQHYLQHGPYVSWGAEFGQNCPEPDFVAAKQRQHHNLELKLRQMLRPFKWGLLALMLGGVGVIGWFGIKKLKKA